MFRIEKESNRRLGENAQYGSK